MSTKLYVGNLPFDLCEEELMEIFNRAGQVASAKLICDLFDGRSRGYGFVEMTTDQEVDKAVETLNGLEVRGRCIRVASAHSNDQNKVKAPTSLHPRKTYSPDGSAGA